MSWANVEGLPYPLGVSWCEADEAYNFALYSKHATSVRLLLFAVGDPVPRFELQLAPLVNKSGRIWHCRVPAAVVDACPDLARVVLVGDAEASCAKPCLPWSALVADCDLAGHRANTAQIMQWCLDGKVSSHIHAVYPLADAPAALKAIAARQVMGKVVLRM